MGKIFLPSEKWDKEKDWPTLTYKNGKISIKRKVYHRKEIPRNHSENSSGRKDLPLFYIDEDGKPVIEKSILDNQYCGKCLRNYYEPEMPRDHHVCTNGDFLKSLPDVEQDSFGKECSYIVLQSLPSYLKRIVSETIARWNERPGKLFSFFKERARRHNTDLRLTKWGERVIKEGLRKYTRKYDAQKC